MPPLYAVDDANRAVHASPSLRRPAYRLAVAAERHRAVEVLIATDLSGKDIIFIQRDGTLDEKFRAMEKALDITPQGEKREPLDPPFSFDAAVQAFKEWAPGEKGRGDEELDPISEMNRKHLSRLGRPRAEIAPVDHETPKRRDRSPER